MASDLATLLDLGRLAAQVAQVVQLRATDVTAGDDLDLLEDRRVEREGPLDTHAEGDLADGEGTADAGALHANDDALELLYAGTAALDDLYVDVHGVAGAEVGDVVALEGIAELGDDVGHGLSSRVPQVSRGIECSTVAQSWWPAAPRSPCGRSSSQTPRTIPGAILRPTGPTSKSARRDGVRRNRSPAPQRRRLTSRVTPGDSSPAGR